MADPNDPWAAFSPQPAPASPSMFGGRPVIQQGPPQREPKTTYSTLSPAEVSSRGLNPTHAYQVSSEGSVSDLGSTQPKNAQSPQQNISTDLSDDHAIKQIGIARTQIDAGHDTGNFFGTGGFQSVPYFGQNAANLHATLSGLQGGIINNTIQQLKQLSATGASGYGSLSETEAERIAAAVAALHQTQDADSLKRNLDELERHYRAARAILAGEDPRDPAVASKYGIDKVGAAPGATGGNPPPSGSAPPPRELTPEQQQQFFAVLKGQGVDAADAYLRQFGLALKSKEDAAKPHSDEISYPEQLGHSFAVGLGGAVQGVGDALGVVSNPFVSGVNEIFGTDYRPDFGANLRDTLGLPAPQNDQEQLVNRINDYGVQGLGFASAAKLAASRVPGVVGSALEAFGNQPLTDSASAASGGGASELTRQAGGGPLAQTAAGFAAGIPTAMASGRINSLLRGAPPEPAVVSAGRQEGVDVPRAMAFPSLEPKVIATGKTMTGAKIMGRKMNAVGGQIENRVNNLGGGDTLDNFNLGETAQGVGKRYIQQSGAQFARQYGKLRQASEDVPIEARQSVGYIDELLQRLGKAPDSNAKEISYLQGVRNDLARGLDVESARDIGSRLSRDIRKGDVTFGPMERDVLDVRKAVSADIANGLAAAGKKGVAAQFKQVDGAYQQRMDFIRNTIQKLTGPRDKPVAPEQAASRIRAWAGAKGDSGALGRIMAQATPEEQADIGSTFATALGKNRKGEFSTAILANNVEAMPERARQILFGPDGAKSLQNIARLAKEHARVTRALGGSPTSLANDARGWILNLLFGSAGSVAGATQGGLSGAAIGGAAVSGGMLAAKIGHDAFSARDLMSPKITGWIRSAPKSADPAAINAWYDRLKVIAVREPALAPEVQRIQDALSKAANSNVAASAAASQPDQTN